MADDLLSSELLALAGEDDGQLKPSRKRQASGTKGSSSKRRKHDMANSDSEGSVESEEEAVEYPLEGKFKDERDREYLMGLPEIRREAILSKRLEDIQKETERKNLERMVKSQAAGAGNDMEGVSRTSKRGRTGASQQKSKTLEALKQKRQAKESRRANKGRDSNSPAPRRHHSETPSDSSDDEDGQVSSRRIDDASSLDGVQLKTEEKLTVQDLQKAQITRDMLANQCMTDRFEEYIRGAWVRVLVGMDQGQNVYRICEIVDISPDLVEPYPLNQRMVNQQIELRHGGLQKAFTMQKVSCGAFTDKEFDRLMLQLEVDKIKPPTKAKLEKKAEAIKAIDSRPRTEAEISSMLERQRALKKTEKGNDLLFKKSGLISQRQLAVGRRDFAEAERITAQLQQIEDELMRREDRSKSAPDAFAKVNERNRKLNQEAMRKADMETIARRKREAAGGAVHDLSARVKTVVKTRFDSRSGTPGTPGTNSQPEAQKTSALPPPTNGTGRGKIDDVARSVVIEDLF